MEDHASDGNPRIAFTTLGCRVNQYDTQALKEQVERASFRSVPFDGPSDIYVINTCTVTAAADGLGPTLRDSRAAAARGTACIGRPTRLRAEVAPVLAVSRAAGELRSCPRCGSGQFSQQPIRRPRAA